MTARNQFVHAVVKQNNVLLLYDNRTTNATKLHGNTCDAHLRYMEGLVLAVSLRQMLCTADHVHNFLHCPFPHQYQLLLMVTAAEKY